MRLKRENEAIEFTLNRAESLVLAQALHDLIANYRVKPHELDGATASAWYSRRGCTAAGMTEEETKEWLDNLYAVKQGAGLRRLEGWAGQLRDVKGERPTLRVSMDDAPAFVTAINDYRLAAAARHEIGQAEMGAHSIWELARLSPGRQKAVLEIHFLAWLIEETLRVIENR
jgi:hypothetical protein